MMQLSLLTYLRNSIVRPLALVVLTIGFSGLTACSIARDQADARAVAGRVHSEISTSNFAAIYHESEPRFRSVGNEADFVSTFQKFQQTLGSLKREDEIAYGTKLDSTLGRTHVLVFELEFEQGRVRESLLMVRSSSGKMELLRLDHQPLK